MKRILSLILVSIMLLTMLISCGNEADTDTDTDTDSQIIDIDTQDQQREIEKITDFKELENMQMKSDKIELNYTLDNSFYNKTIEDVAEIEALMTLLFESTFEKTENEAASSYRLTITQGSEEFIVCEYMEHNGSYYQMSGRINDEIEFYAIPVKEYLKGTPNKLDTTRKDVKAYYEPLKLGDYIGTAVPGEGNEWHSFPIGMYYEIATDYETIASLVSDVSTLNESFFEEYFVFIIGWHSPTGLPYDIFGFNELYYDSELGVASIDAEGTDGFNVTEAYEVYNYFLKIPKGDYYRYTFKNKDTGKVDFNFKKENYYQNMGEFEATQPLSVSEGTAWVFSSREQVAEFAEYYGIKLAWWDQMIIEDNSYTVVICMKKGRYYGCSVGFKDFHSDGENVYLTHEINECSISHEDDELTLMYFTISKGIVDTAISENPKVNILIEENIKEYIK